MRTGLKHGGAILGIVIALGACGGGGDGGGGNNPALTIAKATPSGDAQSDTIGTTLGAPLRVEVKEDGAVVAGRTVAWAVTAGGGQVATPSSQTNIDGIATISWTLGTQAGQQTVAATLTGAGGSPVTFTATAGPGNPFSIAKAGGNAQTTLAGQGFAVPLTVEVLDRAGNPKPGTTIDWTVTSGSLVLDATASQTNAQGIATITVDAGQVGGDATLTASVQGNPAISTVFDLTVVAADRQVDIGPATVFTSVRNGTFNPAVDTVQAGQTVLWVNKGGTHTVRPIPPNAFTGSGNLGVGEIHVVTFNNPGTFQYDCAIHGNAMTGRIVVQ